MPQWLISKVRQMSEEKIIHLRELVDSKVLKEFSTLNPFISISRFIFEVVLILSIAILSYKFLPWYIYPLSILLIASRQHALLVLMHESAHNRICKSAWLNDAIGEFIGWVHFAQMRGYRRHHRKHHVVRNLNTMEDPDFARKQNEDWVFPMKKTHFWKIIVKDILLLNSGEYLQEAKDAKNIDMNDPVDKKILMTRITFYFILAVFFTYYNIWDAYLIFWLIPMFTFLKAILRVRSIVDHFAFPHENILSQTRTVKTPFLERVFLAPCNIGYHNEHHLFASVPYYNLIKFHNYLMKNETYEELAHVSPSYFSAITDECTQ